VANQLSLAPAQWQTRPWLDFVIDGVPLNRSVRADISVFATDLGPALLAAEADRLSLLGGASFADGRQALYVCPMCGDLGCGAVSAVIERDGADVVWRDFGWQTDDEPEPIEGYPHIGPFRFDAVRYASVIRTSVGARYAAARRWRG
jgi:hypothetical protein